MKKFSQRRVPRKVGGEEDDEPTNSGSDGGAAVTESVIKRSTKPRKATNLRKTFEPSAQDDDNDEAPATVVAPKRSTVSKIAIQRNLNKRSSYQASELPSREPDDPDNDDKPSYSAADLQELKNSTPTTPAETAAATPQDMDLVSSSTQALDLSSKFGTNLSRYQQSSAIPSATEIAEKKARRARMAKEEQADEFISLDPDNPGFDEDDDGNVMKDDTGRLILRPKDKYGLAESRLVRDDEDVMEGFDSFTGEEGSRIHMGESTRGDERKRRKEEMAQQIAAAEGEESGSEDDSERERNEAFEAAQTRHGQYSTTRDQNPADARPKTPPKISPLPNLDNVISRLRGQLAEMQVGRMEKTREMEALQREKIRIGEEEVRIQKALKETAEKFEALRREKGIAIKENGRDESAEPKPALLEAGADDGTGLDEDEDDYDDEMEDRPALGLGMARRGLEGLGSSAAATPVGGRESSMSE